jgi:hypothetical protein
VKPLTWFKFTENFNHRIAQTWDRWMLLLNPTIQYLLAGGFIISTLLYRKASNQRIPMQLTLVLAVIILVILQRLTHCQNMELSLKCLPVLLSGWVGLAGTGNGS